MEYAIVDIETTGSYASGNRITEIAIIIHNGREVLEQYETLINPQLPIPMHIQALTGIDDSMVAEAPTFAEVAASVYTMLHKRIFVAHNVNFDYSFLVNELRSAGYDWKAPKLCTVRLARKILPGKTSYSLGKLCRNLGITIHHRHRAMGDAAATVILFELLRQHDNENIILTTLQKTKEQRLPTHINEEDFARLPATAGIYLFRNRSGKIIYIGKAINIRKRVLSHFTGNNTSSRRQAFVNDIYSIEFEETGTELMALLTECKMIKHYWPIHNRALKKYEPKFALIAYEDQNGYLRLAITKFSKSREAIHCFERAVDGNQYLLHLIEKFRLDSRLCIFYSTKDDRAPTARSGSLPSVAKHNELIRQALQTIADEQRSFLLIDRGRHPDEKSYIYYRRDRVHAFGFIDAMNQGTEIDDLIASDDLCVSNYYMNTLVLQYAARFPEKVRSLICEELIADKA